MFEMTRDRRVRRFLSVNAAAMFAQHLCRQPIKKLLVCRHQDAFHATTSIRILEILIPTDQSPAISGWLQSHGRFEPTTTEWFTECAFETAASQRHGTFSDSAGCGATSVQDE